jgi:hypothetical protein
MSDSLPFRVYRCNSSRKYIVLEAECRTKHLAKIAADAVLASAHEGHSVYIEGEDVIEVG